MNPELIKHARFRRLKWNELVITGDFVASEHDGRLESWEGPGGFRADAFVRPIYRATKAGPIANQKRK